MVNNGYGIVEINVVYCFTIRDLDLAKYGKLMTSG
jgi:hypothetical protein